MGDLRHLRDLRGYGRNRPAPRWPGGARLALSIVLNYEEGGESCVLYGDDRSETLNSEMGPFPAARIGGRNLSIESQYEYGARAGFWRIHDLLRRHEIPTTIWATGLALEQNPEAIAAMMEADFEIASHGWRWIDYHAMPEEVEREHIRLCVDSLLRMTGRRPLGFFGARVSPNTRRLIVEEGGFLYDSDGYAEDLPYYVEVGGRPHLVLPYAQDNNDNRFTRGHGIELADDFFQYLKDGFDWLYEEGATQPSMMSVGLHCRLVGRPGRIRGLARFLDYVRSFEKVWICRRIDIARHWLATHPPKSPT